MITERRCQTSVKQAMRSKSAEIIRSTAAKSTYSKLQEAMLGGDLETEIRNAVKAIYPCRNVVIRKSQLLQSGVTNEKGPTLDEIHAEESRQDAELKAKKAAALAAAEDDDSTEEAGLLAAAEAMESISEKEEVVEAPSEEDVEPEVEAESPAAEEAEPEVKESSETESSLMKLKKDELVERAKAKGVATSGTKADIVARLLE
tara:strand:+ start:22 stop:630 length:609 start_codon:yes stop_codon:yes gene_type:complete